jgi:hypothetical protein
MKERVDYTKVSVKNCPGEKYLLDMETALLDATFHYELSRDWTVYAIAKLPVKTVRT